MITHFPISGYQVENQRKNKHKFYLDTMNCIYPSPLLRYLEKVEMHLVLPANTKVIKECRKTPPLSYLR